jgi:hypothetical protein
LENLEARDLKVWTALMSAHRTRIHFKSREAPNGPPPCGS